MSLFWFHLSDPFVVLMTGCAEHDAAVVAHDDLFTPMAYGL